MAIQKTANQQLPYPDNNERLADVPDHVQALAQAVEGQLVMTFASQTDLTTRLPNPKEGALAWIMDSNTLQIYTAGTTGWVRIYPPAPAIYSGSTTPSSTLGTVGDIYIQS